MMNMDTRVALINKEIEVYESYINLIPTISEVIKRFDNKCINKKFGEALDIAINGENARGNRKFFVRTNYGYSGQFEITITNHDDSVKEIADKEYPNYYRVENKNYTFIIPKTDFEITDSGNYRVKADAVIETLKDHKTNIIASIKGLEIGLTQTEEMIAEMKRIKAELEAFKNKYDYHMRDIMGLNFELRDNSSMQYKNYDI